MLVPALLRAKINLPIIFRYTMIWEGNSLIYSEFKD